MIQLFNIEPYILDTSNYDNLLHGKIVTDFEKAFCEYVGAKYACSTSSATAAIFLCFKLKDEPREKVILPSILPPVVANACHHAELNVSFSDDIDWVGWSYVLHTYEDGSRIIDSAQRVDRNQFNEAADDDLMIFSFYPTKPIGSCDGGMIVSNSKSKIEWLKTAVMNGTSNCENSWSRKPVFRGWKMYMNSIQADIASRNLSRLDEKKKRLSRIRNFYNDRLGLNNRSDHLYRISVENNEDFIDKMKQRGIICGKHYDPLHKMEIYHRGYQFLHKSDQVGKTTVSIPFHENLTLDEIYQVLKSIEELQ